MPKLLQINSCLGILSTGRITESIAKLAMRRGWECHIMHGARGIGQTVQQHYQISLLVGEYFHYAESLLLDRHGLGSRIATKKIIKRIKELKPDVIHLHCVHGYYINYKYLFEYLNTTNIPIVWSFHDCWAFTGHCSYFDSIDCKKWIYGCEKCGLLKDYPKCVGVDRSRANYRLKKDLFCRNRNLTIVGVSDWISNLTKKSFFKDHDILTIHNGTDLDVFYPDKLGDTSSKYNILGVAAVWNARKGLDDFIYLYSKLDPNKYVFTLVGLTKEQIEILPSGIRGIPRTNNVGELRRLYSNADVFVNPTYSDNFPTTNIESLACGTPVITYNTGGSPEAIDEKTGVVISRGDKDSLITAIRQLQSKPLMSEDCRERAVRLYNKDDRFLDYIKLYEELITK